MKTKITTKNLTIVGLMAAISTVLYNVLPEIPLVPGVDYLKMDFSDIPAILTGIIVGPSSGIAVEVIKNIIHLFRTTTLGIGEIMNIGIGSAMIISLWGFSRLFSRLFKKNIISPLVYYASSTASIIIVIISGCILNAIFTPIFFTIMGFPITPASIITGVTSSVVLNAVKAAFNLLPFFPVYFAINRAYIKIYH